MALQESFELSDGTGAAIYGTTWGMQSWTTTSAYTITAVALYCYKFGSPGNITVSIRKVDEDGKPTEGDLASVTVSDSVISGFPTRAWYTFTFDTSYALDDATQYAIVFRATSGSGLHYFGPFGYGSSGYANGGFATSTNSGGAWGTVSSTNDMDFRIYGAALTPGQPTIVSPTPTGVADITLDETPLEWAAGDPAGDTYEVYFRESGDDWTQVGEAQAGLEWTIDFGTLAYGTTYEWRIDATNVYGTTTGDTWSFDTIDYDQIRVSYRLLSGGGGVGYGPYDDPPGTEGTDWAWTGESNMLTVKRLVAAANSKIWYESI